MTPPVPNWWTDHDEKILAGELTKLADLPRPATPPAQPVPGAPGTVYRGSRWRRFWVRHPLAARLVILLPIAAIAYIIGTAIANADPSGYRIPDSGYPTVWVTEYETATVVVTPTTYGPPGPNGGPQ